jgi:hypothetical protein
VAAIKMTTRETVWFLVIHRGRGTKIEDENLDKQGEDPEEIQ